MHQFHSKFRKGYSIIKYRSSSKREVIRKILIELWPFFYLDFDLIVVSDQELVKDTTISFKVYRMVKHHKILVKFEFGGHRQNFK